MCEHGEDPSVMRDTARMLHEVSQLALQDAGCTAQSIDLISVPQGSWAHSNPPGVLKNMLNAQGAHTVFAQLGILQQSMFSRAAQAIAKGDIRTALIAGAETRQRDKLITESTPSADQAHSNVPPNADETLRPEGELVNAIEAGRGLLFPVSAYAIIENAFCQSRVLDPVSACSEIDMLWSRMSAVATNNPDAWAPSFLEPAQVRAEPNMAMPYTRAHVSQWNVNQSAALLMCSVEAARDAGVRPQQWIFPWGSAESNHMQTLSERVELHRCMGLEYAACAGLEAAQVNADDVDYWDLYSCFPIAVRLQQMALGLDPTTTPTLTGGMSFGGGPLNNYSLQSTVTMVRALRANGGIGVISSVSGILHKYGIGVWSAAPPKHAPYQHLETPQSHAIAPKPKHLRKHFSGKGRVVSCTVNYREGPQPRLIAIIDTDKQHERAIATSTDPQWIARSEQNYLGGTNVLVAADVLSPPQA